MILFAAIAVMLFLSVAGFAWAWKELVRAVSAAIFCLALLTAPAFAKEDAKLLREVDSVCADTWCEGDFKFKFLSVERYTWEIRVEFQIIGQKKYRDVIDVKETFSWSACVNNDNSRGKPRPGEYRAFVWVRDDVAITRLTDRVYTHLNEGITWVESKIR